MRGSILYTAIYFFLTFAFNNGFASNDRSDETEGWKAGVARVVISPKQSMWMAGYADRTGPSEGKLHDLWAKALALEGANGTQAVLVTTDLLGLPKHISDNIRNRAKEKFKLARSQIILNSSHTHTGPVLQDALFDIYPLDSNQLEIIGEYSDWLENQIVELIGDALSSLKPAKLYSGNGVSRFQVNRRNNNESSLLEQTELNGPNDYAVPVIKVENESGSLMAITFGYACHPTVLNTNKWSGDYPGFAQIELEKLYPGATALFFQGAGGNQNPLPRRSVALAQQYGKTLASSIERVLEEDMQALSPKLLTTYSEVDLTLDIPSLEELKEIETGFSDYQGQWAGRMLDKMGKGEKLESSYPYPLQIWGLGEQLVISLGGEPVIEYAIGLKRIFGPDTFVMGYSNDVMAYIPTSEILQEGGYEGLSSQRAYGMPGKWNSNIEPLIYSELRQMAKKLGIKASEESPANRSLIADRYYSGFAEAHDTYNGMSTASDGKIYYVLSSATFDKGGEMHVYDPKTDKTEFLADLTEISGEAEDKAISQGKSHVAFYEKDSSLYFATHLGFYEMIDGIERLPIHPPEGYKLYPGGHILSYNMSTGAFENLADAPKGEGIITMTMDKGRGHIYGITWPSGYFLHYNLEKDKMNNLGRISQNGEAGTVGEDYRVICRSMFVDDRDGLAYFSTSEGDIFSYDPNTSTGIEKVAGVNLRLDYFGKYDFTRPGTMAYNWRSIEWSSSEGVAYGVHGNSGYLFRFDPRKPEIEMIDRITSEPSKRSGMFDYFTYGYLGFKLNPDNQTLYYLTGGPIYVDGKREEVNNQIKAGTKGLENLHLITYNITNRKYIDHGPIFYTDGTRPTHVNAIAIGPLGNIYTLGRFEYNGKVIEDLIKIPNPFSRR